MNSSPDHAQLQRVQAIVASMTALPGPLLPMLHQIQREFGYIPEGAIGVIAAALNLTRAEVHGVVTFYHFYRTTPPGERTLYVCRAEACQAMGARELETSIKERLGIGYHETTADGKWSLEPIYCLGNCACSPAVMLGEELHGRVTAAKLDEILG